MSKWISADLPAISSATATPSSEALCASIGPRTQSPIAHTPGALVRDSSSTSIWPRSVQLDAAVVSQQAVGIGFAPDADQQAVEAHFALLALDLDDDMDFAVLDCGTLDHRAQPDVQRLAS